MVLPIRSEHIVDVCGIRGFGLLQRRGVELGHLDENKLFPLQSLGAPWRALLDNNPLHPSKPGIAFILLSLFSVFEQKYVRQSSQHYPSSSRC